MHKYMHNTMNEFVIYDSIYVRFIYYVYMYVCMYVYLM